MYALEEIIAKIDCGDHISSDLLDILMECNDFEEAKNIWTGIGEWIETLPENDVRRRQFSDIQEIFWEMESAF